MGVIMKEIILNAIELNKEKLSKKQISRKTNIEESTLTELLKELELEASIIKIDGKYMPFPENHHIGTISLTKAVNKVIYYQGNIYPLQNKQLDSVILNDIVSFTINERNEAIITSIIDRQLHNVTCIVKDNGKKKIIESFHKGIKINLEDHIIENLKDGDIILVNIGINDIENPNYKATFIDSSQMDG